MKSRKCNFESEGHSKKMSSFNSLRCKEHEQYLDMSGCNSEKEIADLIDDYKRSCPERLTPCDYLSTEEKQFYQDARIGRQDLSKWDDIKSIINRNLLNETLLKDCRDKREKAQRCYISPDSPYFKDLLPNVQRDILGHINIIDTLNREITNCQSLNSERRDIIELLRQRSISTLRSRSPTGNISTLSINPNVGVVIRPQSIRPMTTRRVRTIESQPIDDETSQSVRPMTTRRIQMSEETRSTSQKAEKPVSSVEIQLNAPVIKNISPSRTRMSIQKPVTQKISEKTITSKKSVTKKSKDIKKFEDDIESLLLDTREILSKQLIEEIKKSVIGKKQLDKIKQLLKEGADPNYIDNKDLTPLQYAIDGKNYEVIKLLLENGGDVNLKTKKHESPFISHLMLYNDEAIDKLLLTYGGNVNQLNIQGRPVLLGAVRSDNIQLSEKLLKYGAETFPKNSMQDPFFMAVVNNKYDMIDLFLRYGVDINRKYETGDYTIIWIALVKNDLSLVKYLYERGARLDTTDTLSNNILLYYINTINGNKDAYPIIKFLVEHGVDINYENKKGYTPLTEAIKINDIDLVKYLVELGANVNKPNKSGITPIAYAVVLNNFPIATYLVDKIKS